MRESMILFVLDFLFILTENTYPNINNSPHIPQADRLLNIEI